MRKYVLVFLLFTAVFPALSQHKSTYYIIVGAFRYEYNAIRFTKQAESIFGSATYKLRKDRGLFYVYILNSASKFSAQTKLREVQQMPRWKDAWVYFGNLDAEPEIVKEAEPTPSVEKPTEITPVIEEPQQEVIVVETKPTPVRRKASGKYFMFEVVTADGEKLPAEVHWIDRSRGKDLGIYSANQEVDVVNKELPSMTLVAGFLGYKEVYKTINYNDPGRSGAVLTTDSVWRVQFKLNRATVGDIAELSHVSFYQDAVVLLPQSEPELKALVAILKNETNVNVVIHAHCNGKHKRNVMFPADSASYFTLTNAKTSIVNAKQLTEERAELVQDYLIQQGIDAERIKTKGWGGSLMLVKENHPNAKLNDRIEIEIVKSKEKLAKR